MSANKWRVRRAPWDERPWEVFTLAESGWVLICRFSTHIAAIAYADAKARGKTEYEAHLLGAKALRRESQRKYMLSVEASNKAIRAANHAIRHIAAAKRRKQLEDYREH